MKLIFLILAFFLSLSAQTLTNKINNNNESENKNYETNQFQKPISKKNNKTKKKPKMQISGTITIQNDKSF